jgi:hypothetical protein
VLPVLTLAVFGLAIWLSGGRRRLTLRAIGVAVFLSGVIGLLAANAVGWYVVGELTTDRQSHAAGENAWDTVTELLRGSFRLQLAIGLLVLLAAWIAGPSGRAVGVRRTLAPFLRQRRYAYGAVAVVVVALLLTGRVRDFATLLGELVVIGLVAAWIEWMRRQTSVEFPDATGPTILAEAGTQLSGWLQGRRPVAAAGPVEGPLDLTTRLQQLADLHARGELTDEEYAAAKARVLGGA